MLIYLSDLVKDYSLITEQFSDVFNETFLLKTNSILGTLSENIVIFVAYLQEEDMFVLYWR